MRAVGHLVDAVVGHVADGDVLRRRDLQIDVVDADAVADDDSALLHRADHRRRDRRELGDDVIGVLDQLAQFLLVLAFRRAERSDDLAAQRLQNRLFNVDFLDAEIGHCYFVLCHESLLLVL